MISARIRDFIDPPSARNREHQSGTENAAQTLQSPVQGLLAFLVMALAVLSGLYLIGTVLVILSVFTAISFLPAAR